MKEENDKRGFCIVLDEPVPPAQLETLRALSPAVRVLQGMSNLSQANILYTGNPKFAPADAPNLRWIQLNLAGVEHLANSPLASAGLPVANVAGAYSPMVAELAIGLLLALSRRLHDAQRLQLASRWDDEALLGGGLHGKTLAVVGYGNIGRHIARIAHAMGMRILACKRNPSVRNDPSFTLEGTGDPDGALPAQWFGMNEIEAMFRATDHVIVTLPLTRETCDLIGARQLMALPSHALLVNVGRGGIVDEAALSELLRDKRLAGAALDVFAEEPLPSASLLWTTPNLIITPHVASYTTKQAAFASKVLIENVRRDLAQEPLLNLVDFAAGY